MKKKIRIQKMERVLFLLSKNKVKIIKVPLHLIILY